MYFVFIYKNRTMKFVDIVVSGEEEWGKWWRGGVQLRYILSTYVKRPNSSPCTTAIC
jgi:hypothetical protein